MLFGHMEIVFIDTSFRVQTKMRNMLTLIKNENMLSGSIH